jgi:D-glucuronyl C5-epimerase-like protein
MRGSALVLLVAAGFAAFVVGPGDARGVAVRHGTARARIEIETRAVNRAHLAGPRDVRAPSGVVYRRYGVHGYQFQPLASFGRVNALVDEGELRRARSLGHALVARGEHAGACLYWKYSFGVYGGRPGWTSGLTQAVAAQALARIGLMSDARRAFAAIPRKLLMRLPQGLWVRIYSFSNTVVLNAQLQALLSLHQYAALTHDGRASELSAELAQSTRLLLPRFDTGWWSRYELTGGGAPIGYHRYVTSLLWKLARTYGGGVWARLAQRFRVDWRQPPVLSVLPPNSRVYLFPSARRAQVSLGFTVSKPALLTVRIGDVSATAWRPAGRHVLLWRPGAHSAPTVAATISAVDYAGNRGWGSSPAIRVRRDVTPPVVQAQLVGNELFWRAYDRLSRHLRGRLLGPGRTELRDLAPAGVRPLLPGAPPAWLLVADGSGNTARVRLSESTAGTTPWPFRLPALELPAREALIWVR